MFQRLLDQIELRVGRYRGIRNLINIIIAATAAVYVADLFAPTLGFYLSGYLAFDRAAILRGQIWRLVTFVITPPNTSMLFIVMQLLSSILPGRCCSGIGGRSDSICSISPV